MPTKGTGLATDPDVREWPGGFSWLAYPEEDMRRASHALVDEDRVWLVDPVDFEGLDERVGERGDLAGTVLLLDRHKRDAATIARRHDASVHVPAWMEGVESALDAPVARFAGELEGTGFRTRTVINNRFWQECVLWTDETLLVPEAVGSSPFYLVGDERLGVSPVLRLLPPRRQLGSFSPERVLTGHGLGVFEDGASALRDALQGSRRRAPRLFLQGIRMVVSG